MGGRPRLQALAAAIEKEDGGEDEAVFARLADGMTVSQVARIYGCSRHLLYDWRNMPAHAERRKRKWEAAIAASGEALLEQGLEIVDDLGNRLGITPAEVSAANSRANYRARMAGIRDPRLSDKQQIDVNVKGQIGVLHLNALRAAGRPVLQAQVERPAELEAGEDVEIVDVTEEETTE